MYRLDADRARVLLEAEAARRGEEAALRQAAEAERGEWETLALAFQRDLVAAATEQAKLVQAVATTAAQAPAEQERLVVTQADAATKATELDERETRVLIDAQLRDAGREVNSQTLRWPQGARPEKGKHRAIAEVPTWTKADGNGIADYVLFVGTHTTIYFPDVEAFHVALAPLDEQRRIVAKLDAIFEQTRAAKARLDRLPAVLEKLKRSILAAAFRGDLTKDWRAAHPDVEPASALLDRIRAERRRRWEEGLRAKGKDPKKANYEEPDSVEVENLTDLPPGWRWTSLSSLAWDASYGTSVKCDYDGEGECVLRIPNVARGIVDFVDQNAP